MMLFGGLGNRAVIQNCCHPLAFLGFMFVGGGFLIVGITIYLYSLVSVAEPPKA
jgi:hypothetical protein